MEKIVARVLMLLTLCNGVLASEEQESEPPTKRQRSVGQSVSLGVPEKECLALSYFSRALKENGNHALIWLKEAVMHSKSPRLLAIAYVKLGNLGFEDMMDGQYVDRRVCYERALVCARQAGTRTETIFACVGCGSEAMRASPGQTGWAAAYFLEALRHCDPQDTVLRARIFVWLGLTGEKVYVLGPKNDEDLPTLTPRMPEACFREAFMCLMNPRGVMRDSAQEIYTTACYGLSKLNLRRCRPEAAQWWREHAQKAELLQSGIMAARPTCQRAAASWPMPADTPLQEASCAPLSRASHGHDDTFGQFVSPSSSIEEAMGALEKVAYTDEMPLISMPEAPEAPCLELPPLPLRVQLEALLAEPPVLCEGKNELFQPLLGGQEG